jgi:hypothetical protein
MELQVDAKPVNSRLFALVQARSMYVCTTDDGRAVAHMLLHVAMKAGRNVKALTKAVVTFALRTSMLSDTGPPACPGVLHPPTKTRVRMRACSPFASLRPPAHSSVVSFNLQTHRTSNFVKQGSQSLTRAQSKCRAAHSDGER